MKNRQKRDNAVRTYTHKCALLIGNGLNRSSIDQSDIYNWERLLVDLSNEFSNGIIKNEKRIKPFPMFYDAIVNYAVKNRKGTEVDIKLAIQNKLGSLQTSNKYAFLKKVNFDEILTTNYDYLIEQYLDGKWIRGTVTKKERNYSLSRFQQSSVRVWHIHGEQGDIRSMLLGFRLYINYAAQIRSRAAGFISKLEGRGSDDFPPYDSWVDMFFTHNIHIIGLGMEFTEYTLWWLLAYRHFIKTSNSKLIVDNSITFHLPSFTIVEKPELIQMLEAYDINVNPVDIEKREGKNYDLFYEKLCSRDFS
jgi:hypothetical protein